VGSRSAPMMARRRYESASKIMHLMAVGSGASFDADSHLGADSGIRDPIDKPKGMRWATFDRKMDQLEAAEGVCNARLLRFVQKLSQYRLR
jgi:hypothetical protein